MFDPKSRSPLFCVATLAISLGTACGTKDTAASGGATIVDAGQVTDSGASSARTLRTRVLVPPSLRAARQDGFGSSSAALSGQNTEADLVELAYAVRTIAICRTITTAGSAFSSPTDCLTVYDAPPVTELAYDPAGSLAPLAAVARTLDAPFVDLMTNEGRARLAGTHTITSTDAHEYQYGYITWYPPIKVRGSVRVSAASTLRTHDGETTVIVMPDGFRQYITTSPTPLASASAERAVVILPNGGNWFKFQRPLVIAPGDVSRALDAGTPGGGDGGGDAGGDAGDPVAAGAAASGDYDLDLVFDPEALLSAFSERALESSRVSLVDSSGAGIHVPMLDLAPIVRTAGKTTVREEWTADLGASLGYRLSLYGLDPDPNRAIYGVLSRLTMTGSAVASGDWFDAPKIAGVTVAPDGSLSFQDAAGTDVVRAFTRPPTAAAAGVTESAEVRCTGHAERPMPHGFFLPECAIGAWRTVTFTAR